MLELELMERAQQGDKAAYAELIHIHHRTVEKVSFQCGVKVIDIQGVTQEVFVKLYRFLHQFKQDQFTTRLYKITLDTARDYHRKQTKEKEKEQKLQEVRLNYKTKSAEDRVLVFEEDRDLHNTVL